MHLPIRSLSAINRRSVEVMSIAMKSYFDGSGKYHDTKMLTLAGWSAVRWESFEESWDAMLKHHRAPYLHMKEMISPHGRKGGPFKDWKQEDIDNLVDAAIDTAIIHRKDGLRAVSCTISVTEHKAVSASRRIVGAHYLCSTSCLGAVLNYEKEVSQHRDWMEVYYDTADRFFRFWVDAVNSKSKKERVPDLQCIDAITGILQPTRVMPMQLADLLGWLQNRKYTVGDRNEWLDRLLTLPNSCRECVENTGNLLPRSQVRPYAHREP